MPKRTFQPKQSHKKRTHGYRKRSQTKTGRRVLARRRKKGRSTLLR